MILLLMILVAEEYNYDASFQAWTAGRVGMFGFLLGGTFAAIYSGILTVLYLGPPLSPATSRMAERQEIVVVIPKTGRRRS